MQSTNKSQPFVLTLGESLIDQVVQDDGSIVNVVGGSPLNTALALARQGIDVGLVSRISNDELGEMILAVLKESDVNLSRIASCSNPTTRAIATPDGHGGKQYTFDIDGTTQGTWDVNNLDGIDSDASHVVVTAALAAPIESMRIAFSAFMDKQINHPDRILIFDPNVRPALIQDQSSVKNQLEKWISQSTVVKASAEDVSALWSSKSMEDVSRDWLKSGASLVIITDGDQGAHAFSPQGNIFVKAVQIDPDIDGDTIGAGDTFTAGILQYFINNNIDTPQQIHNLSLDVLESAVKAGTVLAGETCKRLGADPPWDETVKQQKISN